MTTKDYKWVGEGLPIDGLASRLASDQQLLSKAKGWLASPRISYGDIAERLGTTRQHVVVWVTSVRKSDAGACIAPRSLVDRAEVDPKLRAKALEIVHKSTLRQVALEFNCSMHQVREWVKRERESSSDPQMWPKVIGRRSADEASKKAKYLPRATEFMARIQQEGWSLREVGEHYDLTPEGVRWIIREAGFQPITQRKNQWLISQYKAFAVYYDAIGQGASRAEAAERSGITPHVVRLLRDELTSRSKVPVLKEVCREAAKVYRHSRSQMAKWEAKWTPARREVLDEVVVAYHAVYGASLAVASVQCFGNVAKDRLNESHGVDDAFHPVSKRTWDLVSMLVPEMGEYPATKPDAARLAEWRLSSLAAIRDVRKGVVSPGAIAAREMRGVVAEFLAWLGQHIPLSLVAAASRVPLVTCQLVVGPLPKHLGHLAVTDAVWRRLILALVADRKLLAQFQHLPDGTHLLRTHLSQVASGGETEKAWRVSQWQRIDEALIEAHPSERRDLAVRIKSVLTGPVLQEAGVSASSREAVVSGLERMARREAAAIGLETPQRAEIPALWLAPLAAIVGRLNRLE